MTSNTSAHPCARHNILIWGHRGHRQHRIPYLYPGACFENSARAFAQALSWCDGVEADVIRSHDETPYLAHDMDTLPSGETIYEMEKNLDAASAKKIGERMMYQLGDAEIATLCLRDGQPVTKFDELLALFQSRPAQTLLIELKGPDTTQAALRSVEKALAQHLIRREQIVFSSFNLPALAQLRAQVGEAFKIAALFDIADLSLTQMYPNWPDAPQDAFYVPFRPEAGVLFLPCVMAMRPDYIHIERRDMTRAALEAIGAAYPQAKINLWTSGEQHPSECSALIDVVREFAPSNKLHAVITDFPDALPGFLKP